MPAIQQMVSASLTKYLSLKRNDHETIRALLFFYKHSTDQPAQILQQISLLQLPIIHKIIQHSITINVVVSYICCGSILSLVQILFPFVLNSFIIHYHTPKQREIKFEAKIKLNHNIYMY